jgi:uncharacterized protein
MQGDMLVVDQPMMTIDQGINLVRMARNAIDDHLSDKSIQPDMIELNGLNKSHGVFVSLFDLESERRLRGCIGDPFPKESLGRLVPRIAIEAATNDFRFRPVRLDELRTRILVEVNVLGPLQVIKVSEPLDYVNKVKVGRDGVMVEAVGTKGLLLPEVGVEERFGSEEFLIHCCLKTGLSPDAWLTGEVRISTFRTQIFTEEKPNGRVVERHLDPGKT